MNLSNRDEAKLAVALRALDDYTLSNAALGTTITEVMTGLLHGWVTGCNHTTSGVVVFMMASNSMGVTRPRRA